MSSLSISTVPKLDGTNYYDWKFAVAMALRHAGIFGVVTGTISRPSETKEGAKWDEQSDRGLGIIGLTVESSQYVHIRSCTKGDEAWTILKDLYEKNSRANRVTLKRAFYTFRHNPERPIRDFIGGLTGLADQLKGLGITLSDDDIIDVIIYALHPDWSNIAGTLTANQATLKLTDVISGLVDEEARRNPDLTVPEAALNARDTHGGRQWEDRRTCYACGKRGHIAARCRSKGKGSWNDGETSNTGVEYAC